MKRIIIMVFCLLMIFLLIVQAGFCYSAKPVTVKISFTAPQKGQQLRLGQPFTCQGKFQCDPRNTKLNQIHIWLFLMDRDGTLIRYWIQKPAILTKKGLWEGTVSPAAGTYQIAAVFTDLNTDIMFKTWVKKGMIGKQYELPRGAQILATVGIKTK